MNNLITDFGAHTAIAIRGIATIIILFQVIPLQVRESGVKNELSRLRVQLLTVGFTLLAINSLAMLLIFTTKGNIQTMSIVIQIINAIATLIFSIVLYQIYHQQYSEENKNIHERIAQLEIQQEVKVESARVHKNKKAREATRLKKGGSK